MRRNARTVVVDWWLSTTDDYYAFCQCLRNGGTFNGVTILKPATLQLMISNHLPTESLPEAVADTFWKWIATAVPGNTRSSYGLGFATALDDRTLDGKPGVSPGTHCWEGAGKSLFFVDPVEDIIVVCMINLMNSMQFPRQDIVDIVYGCLSKQRI